MSRRLWIERTQRTPPRTLEDHKSRISLPVRTQMLPELLEALQQGSAKLALSPELESMLNEAKRDGLALGGDGELEAAGRPWQRW